MILDKKIQFIGFNVQENKFQYLYQKLDNTNSNVLPEIMRRENEKGFNIYEIVNDFSSNRKIEELVGFNSIGLDLDYCKLTVDELLETCTNLFGFTPSRINRTYKGYHVFFSLTSSLYFLSINTYEQLYTHLNSNLNGDLNMRSVTGILKVAGYIDKKDNREFTIETVYEGESEITESNIKSLNIVVEYDEKRQERFEKKKERKERNGRMFENIDALNFIGVLNSSNLINQIKVENNTVVGTGGIKIFINENGISEIKDFSGKGRYGIKGFLFNYVLKENEVDFVKLSMLLNKEYGIKLNKGLNDKPIYNTYLQQNIENNRFSLESQVDIGLVNHYNNLITTSRSKGELTKVLLGVLTYCYNEGINSSNSFYIEETKLLEILNLSTLPSNKTLVRENLLLLSNLNQVNDEERFVNGERRNFKSFKRLFDFSISVGKGRQKTIFELKFNVVPKKSIWINTKILEIKSPNKLYVATKIQSSLSQFGTCNYNLEDLSKELECNEKNSLVFLKDLQEKGIIKNFSKTDTTVYINKK